MRTVLFRLKALIFPAMLIASADAHATAIASAGPDNAATVREIDGRLYVSERGTLFPVPDGPASVTLRKLLSTAGENGALTLEVGRTVVADGGSGWHASDKKP